jgi:Sec-independent protein translocase protein TatA
MKEFKDEMRNEMGDFKGEMSDFKNESRQANREMNRRWGELANKVTRKKYSHKFSSRRFSFDNPAFAAQNQTANLV